MLLKGFQVPSFKLSSVCLPWTSSPGRKSFDFLFLRPTSCRNEGTEGKSQQEGKGVGTALANRVNSPAALSQSTENRSTVYGNWDSQGGGGSTNDSLKL